MRTIFHVPHSTFQNGKSRAAVALEFGTWNLESPKMPC